MVWWPNVLFPLPMRSNLLGSTDQTRVSLQFSPRPSSFLLHHLQTFPSFQSHPSFALLLPVLYHQPYRILPLSPFYSSPKLKCEHGGNMGSVLVMMSSIDGVIVVGNPTSSCFWRMRISPNFSRNQRPQTHLTLPWWNTWCN